MYSSASCSDHKSEPPLSCISAQRASSPLSSFPTLLFRESRHSGAALHLEHDLHELLLDLMCQFSPEQLLSFLQASQHYRLEEAIEVLYFKHSRSKEGSLRCQVVQWSVKTVQTRSLLLIKLIMRALV